MRQSLAFLLAFTVSACSDQSATAPNGQVSPALMIPAALSANMTSASSVWSRQLTGSTGSCALYAFFVPTNWNGDVVYYAHGIVDAALPVALPTGDGFPDLRDALGQLGYAVAYSSFSENGWAVKDGVESTHQLREVFAKSVGKLVCHPVAEILAGCVATDVHQGEHGD